MSPANEVQKPKHPPIDWETPVLMVKLKGFILYNPCGRLDQR